MKNKLLLCWLMLISMGVFAQTRLVTGTVTDKGGGAAMPGVNVAIKGGGGAITNADGTYSVNVSGANDELVFSFIGFASQTMKVGSSTVIDIQLLEDVSTLEEVVISGLATSVKRSNLANSVGTISAKDLVGTTRATTLDGAMNGKLVGANISANSGAPGGGFSVKLRGISSVNQSSEPLYIVDGVYINNSQFQTGAGTGPFSGATGQTAGTQDQATNRIADINPADIENIEVLKGPSAAAIYGTRANAGVIIITTKKGKSGKTSIQFGQDVGIAKPLNLIGMHTTPWDAAKINDGVWLVSNAEMAALYAANGSGSKTTDYEKLIYGNTGKLTTSRLNVSGGNDKIKFYVAGSTTDETGIQKNTGFERHSLRTNIDFKVTKSIELSLNSNYLNTSTSRSFSGNDNNGVSLGYNLAYLPNWLDQNPVNGVYPQNPMTGQNPLQIVDRAENNEKTNRFMQSFSTDIYFVNKESHSLKLTVQGGVDYLLTESEVYMPDDLQFQTRRANPGASRYSKSRNFNTNVQAFLVDDYKVNKLNFGTSLGMVRLTTDQDISYVQGEGLAPGQRNPNTATVRTPFQFFATWQDVGLVAQEEINWDDKIIVTGGIRLDKSSLNGDSKKFYPFAKTSMAINIANFDFWTVDAISAFKLRAAYGQTGSSPAFGSLFTPLATVLVDGKLGLAAPTVNGNPTILPETANEIEFGTDLAFLNNKITLEATYYIKKVTDFIFPYNLAPTTGVTQIAAFNVGDLQNKGVEISLGANAVSTTNFSWNTTLSYWKNVSEITRLIIPETGVGSSGFGAFGTNRLRLNESPTSWYGSPTVGGLPTMYENSQPKFQMSWRNAITFYKNFEFSFLLHTSQGGYNASLNQELTDEGGTSPDWSDKAADGSTPVGVARQLGQPGITTRQFIVDASYIKLREVALYYNVPMAAMPSAWSKAIEGIRVGVSGNNIFMKTNYYGYDPEASNFGNRPVGAGVDLLSFPSSKRFFFHLNINF